jgi:glycerol-3-phosphate dehydrogenase (NAD(P)+)
MKDRPIAVLGGGAWGTALAVTLGDRGLAVRLWMRESDLVDRMRERRDNPVFLPGVRVPEAVEPTGEMDAALADAGLVVGAVPSPFARAVYASARSLAPTAAPWVLLTKGIEEGTLALPLDVAADVLGSDRRLAVLSGPSFASEVARGLPTAVVVSSADAGLAAALQETLSGRGLRIYTNEDPVGVQLGGSLKNVIAIAAGAVDGHGLGLSVVAALVTRGLAEMRRLGAAMGAREETFAGLAGLGDLVLTCTGHLSRNRQVGLAIGRGERIADILTHTAAVPEGVGTTRSARALARRLGIEMPIVEEVHRLLFEGGAPAESVARLMSRPLRAEDEMSQETTG